MPEVEEMAPPFPLVEGREGSFPAGNFRAGGAKPEDEWRRQLQEGQRAGVRLGVGELLRRRRRRLAGEEGVRLAVAEEGALGERVAVS